MSKILIKAGLAFSAVSLSAAAFAGGPDHMAMPSSPSNSSDFFLGAEAGMGMANLSTTFTDTDADATNSLSFPPQRHSFLGGLLGGYQTVFSNNLYLGVAANALYNSLDGSFLSTNSSSNGNSTFAVKNNFQGGADIRLGMKTGNATPYILGGVEAGSWKVTITSSDEPGYSKTNTLVGPKVGAGVLFDLNNNWQAGLEYAYTWFGNINIINSNDTADSVKSTVDQGQIMASVVYMFNN